MDSKVLCKEMQLKERMEKVTGKQLLSDEEINAVCSDLIMLAEIYAGMFGLKIIVTDKMPKPIFTIDEQFVKAGIESELKQAGFCV